MQGKEIVGLPNLGSGMALKRETGIGIGHALAVVSHLNGSAPGINHQHIDDCSTGIDGVFDQLLDDGSRTLNDFAGRYLIGHGIGK